MGGGGVILLTQLLYPTVTYEVVGVCGDDAGDRLRVTREYPTDDVLGGDKHEARRSFP